MPANGPRLGKGAFRSLPAITVSYKGATYGGNGNPSVVLAAVINTGCEIIDFGGYDWLVLEKKDGKALILSLCVLEHMAYNDERTDVTWETCTLRTYLNFNFYNSFSADDKARVVETKISNKDNQWYGTSGGNDTDDHIFLLSLEEVVKYFGDSGQLSDRPSKSTRYIGDTSDTSYISDQYNDARIAYSAEVSSYSWWLRSPSGRSNLAAYVDYHGFVVFVDDYSSVSSNNGVRPAMWITV
jgi:hypothetical protein